MTYYEHIVNQTIQLFPQQFLGKHGPLRASQTACEAFRQDQAVHSTRGLTWPGVRHKVNPGERLISVVTNRIPDECAGFTLQAAQLEVPVGEVAADFPRSGSHTTGGIENAPKCLGKRHSVTSKVTSHRSSQKASLLGRLTGNGMPKAVRDRDEEEANASGNAEDRVVPGLPFQGSSHIPQGVMPADVFR